MQSSQHLKPSTLAIVSFINLRVRRLRISSPHTDMAWRLLSKQTHKLGSQISRRKGPLLATSICQQETAILPFKNPVLIFSAFYSSVAPEEHAKRNYAGNILEYNTVFGSLSAQRRHFLLRDSYEDMMLDGIQPNRDTFHSLIMGTMKGGRLQDCVYFMDEMKTMGLSPDATFYNLLIGTCARTSNSDYALQVFEEMKRQAVKPRLQTYIAMLSACASNGRVDLAYDVIRDMTAAGFALNKFCYAALIIAFKNKKPVTEETTAKIVELVKQSKGWSSNEGSSSSGDPGMMAVSEEELYNLPTADFVTRGTNVLNKQLTVYHTALHACADLGSRETVEAIMEMMKQNRVLTDMFCMMQLIRCYLVCKDFDAAQKVFNDCLLSGKPVSVEFFSTVIQGATVGGTVRGIELAKDALEKLNSRRFFISPRFAGEMLATAAREEVGEYDLTHKIWKVLEERRLTPPIYAVEAYHNGLRERSVPADDPTLNTVAKLHDDLKRRFGMARTT